MCACAEFRVFFLLVIRFLWLVIRVTYKVLADFNEMYRGVAPGPETSRLYYRGKREPCLDLAFSTSAIHHRKWVSTDFIFH